MEGLSIIIPVFNRLDMTLKCINQTIEWNRDSNYEIIIFDNGSTDKTETVLSDERRIKYIRHQENIGISKACNVAARRTAYDRLCFMHNDVFVFEKDWISKLIDFLRKTSKTGVVGLYGAKTIRKDGSFRGKTIVHSKKGTPVIRDKYERVAVVDGLLIALNKDRFNEVEGFNEGFSMHYYDKDISLRVLKHGFVNYVLSIPFEHHCGSTRKAIHAEGRIRDEAQKIFIDIWGEYLPVDVTTWREKLSYLCNTRFF